MGYVGTSPDRKDGLEKACGQTRYIDDIDFGNRLELFTLRSDRAHATIEKIDISKAINEPGVEKIFTHKDIPGRNRVPVIFDDQPALAVSEVRYIGEPIAILAGKERKKLERAASKIKIRYKDLEISTDPEYSLTKEAPRIYGKDNIIKTFNVVHGDSEEALENADFVISRTYRTGLQEHAYLEPQGAVAQVDHNGDIVILGSFQCPYYVQNAVSSILGIPISRIRVIQVPTGGGFGGKEDLPNLVAAHAALSAFLTGKTSVMVYTREEDFTATSKRHPSKISVKAGFSPSGILQGAEVEILMDAGAYSTLTPVVLWRSTIHALGPYRCDNIKVVARAAATNTPPNGAFRGFGAPQVGFSSERIMDEIADMLKKDPVDVRMKNLLRDGDMTITGQKLKGSVGLEKTIAETLKKFNWDTLYPKTPQGKGVRVKLDPKSFKPLRGVGMASVYYGVSLGAGGNHLEKSGSLVIVESDGSVKCAVGNTEMGQGAKTVLSQIAADALGLDYKRIHLLDVDTSLVPDSGPTVASRATFMSGNALILACEKIKKAILSYCAENHGGKASDWTLAGDMAKGPGKYKKGIPFDNLVRPMYRAKTLLSADGFYIAPPTDWDEKTGQGNAYFTYSYSTTAVDLSVTPATGEVEIHKIVQACDVGKAISPAGVEGQIQGGVLQGVGWTLYESIPRKNGKTLSPDLTNYILPTAKDYIEIIPVIVEEGYSEGPFKAKGFGEVPVIGTAPAIVNAISNATGIQINELPILPEKMAEYIKAKVNN